MKKLTICSGLAVAALAVPAQAHERPDRPDRGNSDRAHQRTNNGQQGQANRCTPRKVGFSASGVLVSASLTQTKGQDTERRGDDRYSGEVKVNVKRANHNAPKGEQTYALTDARVRFRDANRDGKADEPKAGDRVLLHGKITRLNRRCDRTGFKPTVTVKHVQFKALRTNG